MKFEEMGMISCVQMIFENVYGVVISDMIELVKKNCTKNAGIMPLAPTISPITLMSEKLYFYL